MPHNSSDIPSWATTLPVRVAIAGLFVELAQLDGSYENEEKAIAGGWLAHFFDLPPQQAFVLRKQAEVAQSKAMTFYGFATKARDNLSQAGRKSLYQELERLAQANGSEAALESNFLSSIRLIFDIRE